MAYRVTGAYVTAVTSTSAGRQLIGFYQGAVLPDDVSDVELTHLLDVGLIEQFGETPKSRGKVSDA